MTFHLICSKSDGSENSKLSSYKCNRNRLQQFLLLFTNHFHYISVWIYISFKIVLIYVCFYCEITYQWLFLLFSSFCDLFFNWDFFISGNDGRKSIQQPENSDRIRASSIHTTWMPTKDDNENDIDMIEVEKDCDYFSMKKDLSTNDAERKRNKKDSCTLQFTKKTPTIIDLHIFI
ncbi:uncharacterized protein LOC125661778 isoform X2 [Ostrea edulis]|uniref:uncharacterized protein LOC130048105 isoform X3 n=1 Tax=Ostrea edulis TaxID=37623 RepID=UPI0024AFAABE|nr:uncharacterized protein LOC130048105 isoform X3 [Ostrea edulis]XP_056004134.1 uncharacterized protein LOC130049912 isoform X1 [Ostrea edulis]XP_056004136.1 uncharacterized protein LOC130049912 isoform X1 [Ostrea edulis]XP_056015824.1 uncharacterized protein LOC125661778 isoform X2 [Ostrea edulis]XP_056015826.1 uncharacterized protein LOC125661778 isoform X2 [Ostrea edulis]